MMLGKNIAIALIAVALFAFIGTTASINNKHPIVIDAVSDPMIARVSYTNYTGLNTNSNTYTEDATIAIAQRFKQSNTEINRQDDTAQAIEWALQHCNPDKIADATLVLSIIEQESSGNPKAVSSAGAIGIMQLMPSTFAEYVKRYPELFPLNDIWDIRENICAGVLYLNDCARAWANTVTSTSDLLTLALASYNVGVRGLQEQYNVRTPSDIQTASVPCSSGTCVSGRCYDWVTHNWSQEYDVLEQRHWAYGYVKLTSITAHISTPYGSKDINWSTNKQYSIDNLLSDNATYTLTVTLANPDPSTLFYDETPNILNSLFNPNPKKVGDISVTYDVAFDIGATAEIHIFCSESKCHIPEDDLIPLEKLLSGFDVHIEVNKEKSTFLPVLTHAIPLEQFNNTILWHQT